MFGKLDKKPCREFNSRCVSNNHRYPFFAVDSEVHVPVSAFWNRLICLHKAIQFYTFKFSADGEAIIFLKKKYNIKVMHLLIL